MQHFDTFLKHERPVQRWFAGVRLRVLRPILAPLDRLGATPNLLTTLSLLTALGIPAGFAWSPWILVGAYGTHLLLDALDGTLARLQSRTTLRGSFLDTLADHTHLVVTTLSLIWWDISHPFSTALYLTSYLLVVVLLVTGNARGQPVQLPVLRSMRWLEFLVVLTMFDLTPSTLLTLLLSIFGIYYTLMFILLSVNFACSLPSSPSSRKP